MARLVARPVLSDAITITGFQRLPQNQRPGVPLKIQSDLMLCIRAIAAWNRAARHCAACLNVRRIRNREIGIWPE